MANYEADDNKRKYFTEKLVRMETCINVLPDNNKINQSPFSGENLMNQQLASETQLVRLDRSALSEAKSILFHACRHEPAYQHIFDSARPGYDQRVRANLRESLELHFSLENDAIGLLDDGLLVAVAFIWRTDAKASLADQINWRIRMMLTAGLTSTRRYMDCLGQIQACMPEESHHELPFIGVLPKYQNLGYGRVLMEVAEGICRESVRSAGIGLSTGNARYLRFYTTMGFKKAGEVKMGNSTETVMFKSCH